MYEIETGAYFPPRKYGREGSINNDKELIERAVEGYVTGKYKYYAEAARAVEPHSITYLSKGRKLKIGTTNSIVDRLQRKISKAVQKSRKYKATE